MGARESWIKRRGQRPESQETTPGGALALAEPMNAVHRCDRCGAQAYVRVHLRSRRELLFCAHHYGRHAGALAEVAIGIQDDTGRLTQAEWPGRRN